jgi:hypothetical protein
MKSSLIRNHVRDKDRRDRSPVHELAKAFVIDGKRDDTEQEYPDHVIYSFARILKPLLPNVNFEVSQ